MAKRRNDEYIEDEEMYDDQEVEETEEEYEEEYVDEKSQRRIARRKRRIRNQIVAYAVLIVLIVAIVIGAIIGLSKLFVKNPEQNAEGSSDIAQSGTNEGYDGGLIQINAPEITLHYTNTENQPEETPQNTGTTNPYDDKAREYIAQMSLEEKVAGLFFVTPESMMEGVDQAVVAGAKTQQALDAYKVGGIIYASKNIQSLDKIKDMLAKTKTMSKYPLFLGAQEEGGNAVNISSVLSDAPKIGNASDIGATGETSNAYNAYSQVATYMAGLGFNVDFAPNAMIGNGKRAFAADADTVSTYIYQSITGLEDNRVSSAVAGFPGTGSADGITSEGRATVQSDLDTIETTDMIPYKMAVNAGADMISVSNVSYPAVVGDYTPATMSPMIVTELLRDRLGYDGIIITEPMNVVAVTEYYTSEQAAVNAILAGCDMILMPEDFKAAYNGVLAAVQNGEISESRIEESLLRIYRVKLQGME
ncbi:MAG: beta-N-acetylhexosaminidase [Lachnospiraceae bacterium]|nr:beta-N-acetylhexosaminidase [Candidatus Merdinaster equi]